MTVIFLPLSAVSSIFGMNTVDIRDMELGQWAYWATAVPVTIAVIFLGLLFTGELRNLALWALGLGKDGATGAAPAGALPVDRARGYDEKPMYRVDAGDEWGEVSRPPRHRPVRVIHRDHEY